MNLSLVAHTCDKYEFCWNGFFHYFDQSFKIDVPKYFLTENKSVNKNGWINIKSGEGEWSTRLTKGLNQITTDYVVYVQEDVWPIREMSEEIFFKVFEFFEKRNAHAVYVSRADISGKYGTLKKTDQYKDHVIYSFVRGSDYVMNHQFAIWKKSALLENIAYLENPWQNELKATNRINQKREHGFYYVFDYEWYDGVVRKGKFNSIGENLSKAL